MRSIVSSVIPRLLLVGAAMATLGGCTYGQSGVAPPDDRIVLPTGIVLDPDRPWMYVVNSNSDLRHNAGTVVAVNLQKAKEDRQRQDWENCPSPDYVRGGDVGRYCCRDFLDRSALKCDERAYITGRNGARIGSFGGAAVLQKIQRDGQTFQRLYLGVRAEPSITLIDIPVGGDEPKLQCTGDPNEDSPFCSDDWKVRGAEAPEQGLVFPEEPYSLVLNEALGALFVGHLFGGVSSIDLCTGSEKPRLAAVADGIYDHPAQGTALVMASAPSPVAPLYATGRINQGIAGLANAAEIKQLFLRNPGAAACTGGQPAAGRDLTLVGGGGFRSSAFYPGGRDIRGLIAMPEKNRLYLLHRNTASRDSPSALVLVDRTPDRAGVPVDRAVNTVEVCGGPTSMQLHDSGRGAQIFVVCFESGQIYVVDPELLSVSAIVNAGRGPTSMVFPADDKTLAYVAGFGDNDVQVVDLRPGSPTEYRVIQRIGFPRIGGR